VSALPGSAGLCADCMYARRVPNRRGSTFLLCGRAAHDPRFARYPALPVLRCAGYVRAGDDPDGAGA